MRIRLLSLIAALALLPMATAEAEPQILGLLATDSATRFAAPRRNATSSSRRSAWNPTAPRRAI